MHTLTLFPRLLDYINLAPTILRLVVSIFLIRNGWNEYKKNGGGWIPLPFIIFGALIFVGVYTQLIAILAIITIKLDWWTKRKTTPLSSEQMMLYVFAGVILLSLLVTGPGVFAFDLPL